MFFLSKQEKSKVKKKTGENGSCYCLFQIWPLTHIFTSFSLQFLFNVTVDSPLFFCQIPDTISRIEHGNLKNLQLEIDLLLMLYFFLLTQPWFLNNFEHWNFRTTYNLWSIDSGFLCLQFLVFWQIEIWESRCYHRLICGFEFGCDNPP